jgi:hypothetical protein
MKIIWALIFALLFMGSVSAKNQKTGDEKNCKIMHEGTFKYKSDPGTKVKITGNKHVESYKGGKYIIESDIAWVNDCEYNLTMVKITLPDFPFKPGDKMNVKITKVEGKTIYYTATVNGKNMEGVMIKIK